MKTKHFTLICMLLAGTSFAHADEPLPLSTELLSQEQAREMYQTLVDNDETPAILQAMHREQFRHANIVRVQKEIEDAQKDGLPTTPLTDKVYEGIAKNIDEEAIVRAVTRVRNRYAHAYRQAHELVVDPEQEELLGNLIADAYTAGLTEEDCDTILAALQTRTRTKNQRLDQELTIQTMTTARFMAHRDVRSTTVSEVLVNALDKSYGTTDLKEMQYSFLNRARYGSAETIAQQFSDGINQGLDAAALGHSQERRGESDGSGGAGENSGGAGSGGSNSSGGNSDGAGSGGSDSSGGNSDGASSGGSDSSGGNSGGASSGGSNSSGGNSSGSGGSGSSSGGGRGK